ANTSQVMCPTGCFDTATDPNNCGSCGNSCGPGGTCAAGVCTCAAAISMCGAGCADLANDPNHCGRCTNRCAMGSVACSSGLCQTTLCDGGPCCAAGFTQCPGGGMRCVDLQTNATNCGTCGN